MTDLHNDSSRAKKTLHELNALVQADPSRKLEIIQKYYADHSGSDLEAADMALIVKDIAGAGGSAVDQTSHLRAATPVLIVGMCLGTLASIAAIGTGGYAIYKGQTAATEIHLFGNTLTTQSVGIALVFIGILGLGWVIRKGFNMTKLRKL